jgi:branched-chain amino acid transport system permease protein
MSAAYWRRAMNTGLASAARPLPLPKAGSSTPRAAPEPYADSDAPRWLKFLWSHLSARHVFVLAFVLIFPFVSTPFITFQVASQALVLGLIALSLMFLAGYGGMVSLSQLTGMWWPCSAPAAPRRASAGPGGWRCRSPS